MKKTITFFCMFVFIAMVTYSDIYVKENLHFDTHYNYGSIQPEDNVINEWWFGDNKVALLHRNWRISLDNKIKRLVVVNHAKKTFIEVSLPLKCADYVDEALAESLERFQIDGKIKKTGKREEIDKKMCDINTINEWIIHQNLLRYECERRVMTIMDVPFDWQLVNELHQCIRAFFNPKETYLKELNNVRGFMYASNNKRFYYGAEVKWSSKILGISKKKAPKGVYGIPEGFKKNEKFTISELIRLRGLVYIK